MKPSENAGRGGSTAASPARLLGHRGPALSPRASRVPPLVEEREHRAVRATMSSAALIIIALGIGLVLAAVLGATIWGIATALHHAATS